jgi:hypothetical protein
VKPSFVSKLAPLRFKRAPVSGDAACAAAAKDKA